MTNVHEIFRLPNLSGHRLIITAHGLFLMVGRDTQSLGRDTQN